MGEDKTNEEFESFTSILRKRQQKYYNKINDTLKFTLSRIYAYKDVNISEKESMLEDLIKVIDEIPNKKGEHSIEFKKLKHNDAPLVNNYEKYCKFREKGYSIKEIKEKCYVPNFKSIRAWERGYKHRLKNKKSFFKV